MTTTSDKYTSNAVALIIGVNDYKAFDSEGKSDLRGSLNDVEAVVDFCTWRLGMDGHNVKALNDPTEAEIFEKIKWLKEELSSGDKQGLLWYSGHGAHTPEEGLLLCPTDTTKDYKNTVAFKELGRHLGTKAAKNLTVVLDCCHGGLRTDSFGRPSTTLGGPVLAKELNSSDLKIGSVVLTACAVGEQSQQSRFGGKWHGAFTWALLSVASQWQRVRQGENLRLDLTYRELVKKATVLLDALEFPASPQVYPRTAGALSVMQMGETLLSTEIAPSANRGGIQLNPDTINGFAIFTFTLTFTSAKGFAGTTKAWALVPGSTMVATNRTWAVGKEYWNLSKTGFNDVWCDTTNTGVSLSVSYAATKWTENPAPEHSVTHTYSTSMSSWSLVDSAPATTRWSGTVGLNFPLEGGVDWYYAGKAPPTYSYILSSTSLASFSSTTAPPGNKYKLSA